MGWILYLIVGAILLVLFIGLVQVSGGYGILLIPLAVPSLTAVIAIVLVWIILWRMGAEVWIALALSLPLLSFVIDRLGDLFLDLHARSMLHGPKFYLDPLLYAFAVAGLWRLATTLKHRT